MTFLYGVRCPYASWINSDKASKQPKRTNGMQWEQPIVISGGTTECKSSSTQEVPLRIPRTSSCSNCGANIDLADASLLESVSASSVLMRLRPVKAHQRKSSIQSTHDTSGGNAHKSETALSKAAFPHKFSLALAHALARPIRDGRVVRDSCCSANGGSLPAPIFESKRAGIRTRKANGTKVVTGPSCCKAAKSASKKFEACEAKPPRFSKPLVATAQDIAAARALCWSTLARPEIRPPNEFRK
mmetsp:Transcript_103094/g.162787  ORF Transcript_103094/g.162787 Transcript_103094/m.162787 type:complete len:244 (-) Transcript_103094:49-780(-)